METVDEERRRLMRDLRYFQRRRREHLDNLEQEINGYYHAALNDLTNFEFDDIVFVQHWRKQLAICDSVIAFYVERLREIYS